MLTGINIFLEELMDTLSADAILFSQCDHRYKVSLVSVDDVNLLFIGQSCTFCHVCYLHV